ncbi:germ cell nuclear acidic protein isoform X2 [Talpa occidentalis]|nr:germ cell nuclear acidic protein isoform X2 [Talpa occidentalis]XP_054551644.1 germ cell nuclear acidic protein isoform X2 [Talpa occidentalis]
MSTQKNNNSYMVIDSESDDEHFQDIKRAKITEINSEDEFLETRSDIKEHPNIQDLPVVITDDESSNLEAPIIIEDSCYQDQISSSEEEMNGLSTSQSRSRGGAGEQHLDENLCQPPSDPEANLEASDRKPADEEPVPVAEQPRKRKKKTKNITVTPAVEGRKTRGPSKKKANATEEKSKTGDVMCNIPGCFLHDLEKSKQYSGKKFKQNKDELVQKIYALFNRTVFDEKMPEKIDIGWNKKMLRTAGLCTTGEIRYPKRERYAKIEISLKVCDSADRLRDTLIHEICHAASWLLDGVRDSHGDAWKYYAQMSNLVHPELPKVTRCHNYKINYRIHYECTQCKTRVGRYTRSLNTERFICAKCRGTLVMLPLTRKDGTPIVPHVRPFAMYVKEYYRIVRQQTEGISHGDVMKKLGKDFVAKKQNQGR